VKTNKLRSIRGCNLCAKCCGFVKRGFQAIGGVRGASRT
jgi:hypothetical protein